MLGFLNLQPEIFGIDVNDLSLRLVKLRKKHKGFGVVSFNEVDIKPGVVKDGVIVDQDALAKIIASACKSPIGKKLGTKYVVISLPEEKSFSQTIQMPVMTHEELTTAVPLEAENYIPLAIDKVYLDFSLIDSAESKKKHDHLDLLINVMPRPIIDSYVACFKKAGLIPCVLEVESQAIARALVKKDAVMPPTILIDLGSANTSFIIYSGNSIHFTSSIPVSSRQLTEAIAKKLDLTPKKADELKMKYGLTSKKIEKKYDILGAIMDPILTDLATQIEKYITFYKDHAAHQQFEGEGKISKIILCGGGANLKELPGFLFEKLKIPVEVGNPFANIVVPRKNNRNMIPAQKALSFTTALGLALRGVGQENS